MQAILEQFRQQYGALLVWLVPAICALLSLRWIAQTAELSKDYEPDWQEKKWKRR